MGETGNGMREEVASLNLESPMRWTCQQRIEGNCDFYRPLNKHGKKKG